ENRGFFCFKTKSTQPKAVNVFPVPVAISKMPLLSFFTQFFIARSWYSKRLIECFLAPSHFLIFSFDLSDGEISMSLFLIASGNSKVIARGERSFQNLSKFAMSDSKYSSWLGSQLLKTLNSSMLPCHPDADSLTEPLKEIVLLFTSSRIATF